MKTKIRKFFQTIGNFLYDFRIKKLGPIFQKLGYFLTHNFVLRKEENQLIIFRFLKIKITNRRREAVVGYFFILLLAAPKLERRGYSYQNTKSLESSLPRDQSSHRCFLNY
jgi:hypothetical protein